MANNLRIVSNNVANIAVLSASSTAGSLSVSNLLTDIKSQIWRATGTSATITASWSSPQLVGVVALPYCNLSSTATIRVRGYSDTGITLLFDTGAVPACQYAPLGMWNWGMLPLGVNAFPYGGSAYANVWTPVTAVKQLTIDLADSTNVAGYIEAGRLVIGNYWSPTNNAEYGASVVMNDTSVHSRNDAGDLLTYIGTRSRTISVNVTNMFPADRAALMSILVGNSLPQPVYFSLYPSDTDPQLEQTYQVYCKMSTMSPVTSPYYNAYSAPLELQEI